MKPRAYNLPDATLLEGHPTASNYMIWNPRSTCLVLGNGNKISDSIYLNRVKADKIPVYKRPSGGETVLLSPQTLVVSILLVRKKFESIKKYFPRINEKIIKGLQALGIKDLYQKGISDISINDKKIAGSAVYQNREKIFYHAVLNINETSDNLEKYIKQPAREPDYRKKRNHRNFVTSIRKEGYPFGFREIKNALIREFIKPEVDKSY